MDPTDFLFEFVLVEKRLASFVHVQTVRDSRHDQFHKLLST